MRNIKGKISVPSTLVLKVTLLFVYHTKEGLNIYTYIYLYNKYINMKNMLATEVKRRLGEERDRDREQGKETERLKIQ